MSIKTIATNRKAYHRYSIHETFEAGIVLAFIIGSGNRSAIKLPFYIDWAFTHRISSNIVLTMRACKGTASSLVLSLLAY